MAVELVMPRLSDAMTEGTIAGWYVHDGTLVAGGQPLAAIATGEGTFSFVAPEGGVVRILAPPGATLGIGQTIGLIDDPPRAAPHVPPIQQPGPAPVVPATQQPSPAPPAQRSPAWGGGPVRPVPPAPPGELAPVIPAAAAPPAEADESETTEFAAVPTTAAAHAAAPTPPPVAEPEPAPVREPAPEPVAEPEPAPLPEPAPTPIAEPAAAPAPIAEPAPAVPAREPAPEPQAAPEPAATPEPTAEAGPLSADQLIGPPTLPPRPPQQRPTQGPEQRIVASPVARKLAAQLGIELASLKGTGPDGRIVKADVQAAQATGAARPPLAPEATPQAASDFAPQAEAAAPPEQLAQPEPEPELEATPDPEPTPEPEPAPEPTPEAKPEPEVAPEPEAEPAPTPAPQPTGGPTPDPAGYVDRAPTTPTVASGGKGEPAIVEQSRAQQTLARRVAESRATIPSYDVTVEVDASPLLALRVELAQLREDLAAPSLNDLVVKAAALALRDHPSLNGAYRDGRIEQYPRINVGIATESGDSLLLPVVHDADQLTVAQIAARTAELLEKASGQALRPADLASSTFTISNLGTHGVDEFTAIILPGQMALLTVGQIAARPVVKDRVLVAGHTVRLTLTVDHRAVYGVEAAQFLGRVRRLLEHPAGLLA